MLLNFAAVIALLGPDAAFRIANAARAGADYFFATLLPERNMPTYDVKSGSMTVRATMAGLTGMDSTYPPTGVVEASTFLEQSAKIANHVPLPEASIRQLQALLQSVGQAGGVDAVREALNFLDKAVIQPHLDTMEYLRGEALTFGAIDWTHNRKRLQVNYGIPAANLLTNRAGTDFYGGTTSKFWEDIRSLRRLLKYDVRAFIVHPETMDLILSNTANAIAVQGQDGGTYTLVKYLTIGGNTVLSTDVRDRVTFVTYDREGEILDLANPGKTIRIPFLSVGKILAIGNNRDSGYRVGMGATDDPIAAMALGYTHLAPTVEGGGRPGRWSRLFTPENLPMQLHGQCVTNGLPVIEAPAKIAVASTNMS